MLVESSVLPWWWEGKRQAAGSTVWIMEVQASRFAKAHSVAIPSGGIQAILFVVIIQGIAKIVHQIIGVLDANR